jgi:hypothetical protein
MKIEIDGHGGHLCEAWSHSNGGCRLLLMEFNDSKPVPEWFWFIPRRGIIRFLFKG